MAVPRVSRIGSDRRTLLCRSSGPSDGRTVGVRNVAVATGDQIGRFVANLRADTSDNLEMEFDTVGGNARALWSIAGADEAVEPILEACNY